MDSLSVHLLAIEKKTLDLTTQTLHFYCIQTIKRKTGEESVITMETGSLNTTSIDCF